MGLVGLLRVHLHGGAVRCDLHRIGFAGLAWLDRADSSSSFSGSPPPMLPPTPTTVRSGRYQRSMNEVNVSRVAERTDSFVPMMSRPSGLVAVEQVLVDTADEVPRRVEVHVHLLDDDALLAVYLLGVESRVADHADEHVERDVAGGRGALDVVARVLLAGERVELAADAVDLGRDVPRAGRRSVPLKNMCSAKWAMPPISGVSKSSPRRT